MNRVYKATIFATILVILWNVCPQVIAQDIEAPRNLKNIEQNHYNLLENSNFDLTLTDSTAEYWKYSKIAVSVVNDVLKTGNKCLKIVTNKPVYKAQGMPYIVIDYTEQIPVKADNIYNMSFDIHAAKYGIGYSGLMYVRWLDKNGKPASIRLGSIDAAKMANSKWATTQGFVASPKDAVKAEISLIVWASGTEVYVDNVLFNQISDIHQHSKKINNPLKIMYSSAHPDRIEEARRVRDSGFAISYLYWKSYEPKRWMDLEHNLKIAKMLNLPVFVAVWLSEVSSPDFRELHPLIDFEGNEHGKTPSIFHEEWWDKWFIPTIMKIVNASQQYGIKGVLIDFELYDKPSQIRDVCYCNKCLTKFSQEKGISLKGTTIPEKTKWLLEHDYLGEYREFQKHRLEVKLNEVRNKTDVINKEFQFGDLPYYDLLVDRSFAERLGKKEAPFIIDLESTYNLQSESYSDTTGVNLAAGYLLSMNNNLSERGYNFIVLGGVSPWTTIDFMEKKIDKIHQIGHGYWFFSRRFIDHELIPSYISKKRLTREQADHIWEILRKINIEEY